MNKFINRVVWLVCAAPAVYLALVWEKLPDQIALHFDLKGKADRIGSKNELLIVACVMTGMSILMYLILTNIYRIDPKKYAAENKSRLQRIAFATVVFLSAILSLIIYNAAKNTMQLNTGIIFSATGLFLAIVGNYLPNLKPNYFAGLRLPWTLEDPENWKKTHSLAGKLWFIGGLLLAVICLFLPAEAGIILFFAGVTMLIAIPCIYSYRLYRSKKLIS
jgi:uncharacterized membrane protein